MPLVRYLRAGEKILLAYGGDGEPYLAQLRCTIAVSAKPVEWLQHLFPVFSYIVDDSRCKELKAEGYQEDPVIKEFTGITLAESLELPRVPILKPPGLITLCRWDKVARYNGWS